VIKAWGLRYGTGGAWHKRTRHGKTAFGTGYRARSSCEPFLLCFQGAPKTSRSERNLIEGLAREHSRKPEEGFHWFRRYLGPHARLVELFSRQTRGDFDTWGYERGKLDPVVVTHDAEDAVAAPSPVGRDAMGQATRAWHHRCCQTTDGAPHATERFEPIPRRLRPE
jgi:hypothetical protein